MKTDPRTACANVKERRFWAIIHDLIAHPLMAATNWAPWAVRFHDWTSHEAWPRQTAPAAAAPVIIESTKWGTVRVLPQGRNIFSVMHPMVNHRFTTWATSGVAAAQKAMSHFDMLAVQFGGAFTAPGRKSNVPDEF